MNLMYTLFFILVCSSFFKYLYIFQAQIVGLAMDASWKSQNAVAAANLLLAEAGNKEGISSLKRVLDFSFHDVDGFLHLVRLAMEALNS